MTLKAAYLSIALSLAANGAMGFSPVNPATGVTLARFSASSDNNGYSDELQSRQRDDVLMSQSIPFLACPKVLAESDLAGNVGFDPLGFAEDKEHLWAYREAEIKHARLAMMAAVGWPLSELWDRSIADFFSMPAILDETDRAPSVLNGGLERISPVWWGFCLGLTAAIDMYGIAKSRAGDPTYFPGNLGFDPLKLYPDDKSGQQRMQLAEIKHGRLAMVAVLVFAIEEYVTKLGVVDETPILFNPSGSLF